MFKLFECIGSFFRQFLVYFFDLFGLIYISIKSTTSIIDRNKRHFFTMMFRRQILKTGVQALYINGVIAILIGAALISQIKGLASGASFGEVYANLFIILVVRELGPLISGVILISRSAAAVTAEIGHLKLSGEFEVLRGLGINPVYLFLAPVFYAFPISLITMFIYFDVVSILSAYIMIFFLDPSTHFYEFILGIMEKITLQELSITILKGVIGGIFIGVVSIYFGSQVQNRFSDVTKAIANATTFQLILFFVINVGFSILAYRS